MFNKLSPAVLVFLLCMAVKTALIGIMPTPNVLCGDEHDYMKKALSLWTTGMWPIDRTGPRNSGAETTAGYSDFRPPGFPLIVYSLLPFGTEPRQVRSHLLLVHTLLDWVTTCTSLWIAFLFCQRSAYRALCAIVLGIQPFTICFIESIYPDNVTKFSAFIGVVCVAAYCAGASRRPLSWLLLGSSFLSVTYLIRVEMLFIAVPMLAGGLTIYLYNVPSRLPALFRHVLIAATPLCIAMLLHAEYRVTVDGRACIVPEFRHATPGLVLWSQTWIGSEKQKESVVWGVPKGNSVIHLLPERAFDSSIQKQWISTTMEAIERSKKYTPEDDQVFARIARERIGGHRLLYYVYNRLWNMVHVWLSLESSGTALNVLSLMPRIVSRIGVVLMFALRLCLIGSAVIGVIELGRSFNGQRHHWWYWCLVLGAVFVAGRTALFGIVMNTAEYRYILLCWPFVLLLAAYGMSVPFTSRLAPQRGATRKPRARP